MNVTFDPETEDAQQRYAKAVRLDGRKVPYSRYQYGASRLKVAVNAALATRRPLLLRGEAGSGKSSLAYDVAIVLGWTYYERVVSSRMTASDLLWQYDAIERLNDSATGDMKPPSAYLRPETLWWAFAPERATEFRGATNDPARIWGDKPGAVVLLDEIDKADPDLPNDLLVPLGEGRFRVRELGDKREVARSRDCLIVITSNGERELPAPFLRRCVCQELATPGKDALMSIARVHRPELKPSEKPTKDDKKRLEREEKRAEDLITRMFAIRAACKSGQHKPGTAEILDALHACFELGITSDHADWKALTLAMGWKNSEDPPAAIAETQKATT